jgi:hypothetical protein
MATLTSTKIKNTYDALLKSIDNDAIGTTAKQITDGLGNVTPLYISTTQVGIGVTPEAGLNLHVFGDAKIGSNLTVIGNLVVEGSTTTVGTDTLTVKDPLIVLANNNTSTDAVDIGFYGKYTPSGTTLYSGLFREALTGKYRLFKGLEDEPTTTVNTGGTGYAVASLVANLEGNVTGNLIGSVTGGTFSGTLLSNVVATTQSANDNSTKVATTAYVDSGLAGQDTLAEILANGNTTGGTDIVVSADDDVTFTSSSKLIFTGGVGIINTALEMYHDGTDGYIDNINGELILQNNSDDKKIIFKSDNGIGDITEYFRIDGNINRNVITVTTQLNDDVPLIFGDGAGRPSIKYDSTASQLLISGESKFLNDLYCVGDAVFNGNINLDDDERIRLGTSNAFQLYYDSTLASGQGGAIIDSNRIFIQTSFFQLNSRTGESMIRATSNSDVELYYDNSKKLETTSTGITVTGTVSATAFSGNITGGTISGTTGTFTDDLVVDTDTLFVDASEDSVGIGLTNPADYTADELVISVPDGSGMTLVSGTTDAAYIAFANATSQLNNYIGFDHDTDTMSINNFGGDINFSVGEAINKMTINSSGITFDDEIISNSYATIQSHINIDATVAGDPYISFQQDGTQRASISYDDTEEAFRISTDEFFIKTGSPRVKALTVDSSQNVGIGTDSPQTLLNVNSLSGTTYPTLGTASGVIAISINELHGMYLGVDGSSGNGWIQAMREDATATAYNLILQPSGGNVGIGRTDPNARLDIKATGGSTGLTFETSDASNNQTFYILDGGRAGMQYYPFTIGMASSTSAASGARFQVATTGGDFVVLNDGKTGIGTNNPDARFSAVSSSANSTIAKIGGLEYSGTQRGLTIKTFQSAGGDDCGVEFNAAEGLSGYGSFIFKADTAERMRIDSSGNVGIGDTSPQGKLEVNNRNTATGAALFIKGGEDDLSPIAGQYTGLAFGYGGGDIYNNGAILWEFTNTAANGKLHFAVNPTAGDGTANLSDSKMTILDSGNVGIGLTNPQFGLSMAQGTGDGNRIGWNDGAGDKRASIICSSSTDALQFHTGTSDTERMRITSGGDVFLGKTVSAVSTAGILFEKSSNGLYSSITNSQLTFLVYETSPNAQYRFYVTGGGQIHASSTSITALSDITLKENIKPLETGLNEVIKLKPRRFDWKNGDGKNIAGFVAQEVEEILPDLVSESKYTDKETKKSLKMGDMIPTLVKAIQELKAEVDKLKQECKCKN